MKNPDQLDLPQGTLARIIREGTSEGVFGEMGSQKALLLA